MIYKIICRNPECKKEFIFDPEKGETELKRFKGILPSNRKKTYITTCPHCGAGNRIIIETEG